ncbi:hypothetical protein AB1Y20_022338 [Prymnesium parvum]|uniref:Cilia- and flagella-associated protein 36 n=1 Tax=Prymnesium parvum TaxID=97485 RepID=A0AB34JI40_PRYPA
MAESEVLEVICPEGCEEGAVVCVHRPSDGAAYEVVVPAGVHGGVVFEVELPPAPLPSHQGEAAVPAQVVEADNSEAAVDGAAAERRLSPEQAATLKAIIASLQDFDELGWFIEHNCREFRDFDKDGEQRLEWCALHQEYTRLVEGRIEQQLSYVGADGDDLFALLEEMVGEDSRADSFLNKILSMEDYSTFCSMMRWLGRIERRKYSTRL